MSYFAETEEESPFPPLTSLELLKQHGTKVKRLREEKNNEQSSDTPGNAPALSTESIMKLAKARLLQFNSQNADVLSNVAGCFGEQSGLPSEVSADLELALVLQAAAEKVANKQFVHARRLLSTCDRSASICGNPVQRIAYYFAEAFLEKIDQEWGIIPSTDLEGKPQKKTDEVLDMISLKPEMMTSQQDQPFCLVTQFTTIDSILENVASAKRIHLIDFSVDNGSQWMLVMQAFSIRYECPVELLKITVVGTCKKTIEDIGKWLTSFAQNINLPFSFNIVVSDLKNLKLDFFKLDADETVAINLQYRLWTQLAWPNHLEALIGVLKTLKPCVMVVRELEVRANTSVFLERFNETLFYFSAMFDCLKASMGHHILYRKLVEEVYFREMIRNIITAEGTERYQRYERITFWRVLFEKFGFVETDLSRLSLCQASLLLRRSDRLSSCSLDMDGKCMILGWKGTPLESISVWKVPL